MAPAGGPSLDPWPVGLWVVWAGFRVGAGPVPPPVLTVSVWAVGRPWGRGVLRREKVGSREVSPPSVLSSSKFFTVSAHVVIRESATAHRTSGSTQGGRTRAVSRIRRW